MTRTITRSEFQNAAGEAVYVSHVHYQSRAEQAAGDAACQAVVVPAAFVPALSAGPAFDSPEFRGPLGTRLITDPSFLDAYGPATPPEGASVGNAMPPNCMDSGYALAHAQHEAAIDGGECTNGVCLMTRGAND